VDFVEENGGKGENLTKDREFCQFWKVMLKSCQIDVRFKQQIPEITFKKSVIQT
jgi:hypothetical protein